MSELKATTVYDAYWTANSTGQGTEVLVYIKSEADKVIARNKYKRCLAMAKWCDDAARLSTWDSDYHRCGWYNKWMQRWLAIADKYKEGN